MAREPNETGRLGPGMRLGLSLAGVVLGLLVLEFGLRLGGQFLLNAEARRNHRPLSTEAPLVVLCLGESTTFMGGKVSYPRQLEGALASQLGAGTVRVINEGIPATTTASSSGRKKQQQHQQTCSCPVLSCSSLLSLRLVLCPIPPKKNGLKRPFLSPPSSENEKACAGGGYHIWLPSLGL